MLFRSTVLREDIEKVPELKILASAERTGVYAVSTKNGRQIFITGHSEYYMYQNGLCFEEYIELLKANYNSSAKRLVIAAADGFNYEIYYVAASGDDITTLSVPTNYNYTVSGDNRSGFIVTVKMTDPAA